MCMMIAWILQVLGCSNRSLFVNEVPSREGISGFLPAKKGKPAGMEIGAMRLRWAWTSMIGTGVCGKGIDYAMAASDCSTRSVFVGLCNHTGLLKAAIVALLLVLKMPER